MLTAADTIDCFCLCCHAVPCGPTKCYHGTTGPHTGSIRSSPETNKMNRILYIYVVFASSLCFTKRCADIIRHSGRVRMKKKWEQERRDKVKTKSKRLTGRGCVWSKQSMISTLILSIDFFFFLSICLFHSVSLTPSAVPWAPSLCSSILLFLYSVTFHCIHLCLVLRFVSLPSL